MRMKKFNDEVMYPDEDIVKVRRDDIQHLKELSKQNVRKRVRLCAHKTVDETVHEMLIVHARDAYVRPHRHVRKAESFHVIEGRLDVAVYDDHGNVKEIIPMGEYSSGRTFYYRISPGIYHTIAIESDFVVFHEATEGPFKKGETEFAPWSPDEKDPAGVKKFVDALRRQISAAGKHG